MFHQHLRSWMHKNKVTFKELSHLVGVKNLTHYTTGGKCFPAEWIRTWAQTYGWTDEEVFTFQYDQEPEFEEDEIVAISMKRLKELLEAKHDTDLFGKVK
jgi:hypothetical protein